MRIVFVTSEYVTESNFDGGLANYLYRVSLSLIKLGHQPAIVVTSSTNEILNHNGIEVYRVKLNFSNLWFRLFDRLTLNKLNNTVNWLYQSWRLNRVVKKVHKKKL